MASTHEAACGEKVINIPETDTLPSIKYANSNMNGLRGKLMSGQNVSLTTDGGLQSNATSLATFGSNSIGSFFVDFVVDLLYKYNIYTTKSATNRTNEFEPFNCSKSNSAEVNMWWMPGWRHR